MAKVLVTGSLGMLGRRLVEKFGQHHEVVATARREAPGVSILDITDRSRVLSAVAGIRPDWIVNAAAYTAVDRAESDIGAAFALNAAGPRFLAEAADSVGARLLHISTDFVFSGAQDRPYHEEDATGPVGVYARSKEAGERWVSAVGARACILRVAWLFGRDGKNFVDTMIRLARERPELRVVADQTGTPTFTTDAAALAVSVMEAGLSGIVHGANSGVTNWCEFAREIVRQAGESTPVQAITTADYPTPASRPRNSALENRVVQTILRHQARPWPEALSAYLKGE